MQLVLPWEKGIILYQSEFKKLQLEKPERCQKCGCAKFHKWGKYVRYVIEETTEHQVYIQRICCVKCLKTYSYLPSFCLSGISYGLDFVIVFLKALVLKTQLSLGELRRRAYAYLKRFTTLENLWLVFLRARGFGEFSADSKERKEKIFTALMEFYENGSLLADFFQETRRHFMSVK